MENASKALIIAGAILISILLISVGIIIMNTVNAPAEEVSKQGESTVIQSFNSRFTGYEGKKSGSALKNLSSDVRVSNAQDPTHIVTIDFDDTGVTSTTKLTSNGYYNVEITDYYTEGYVKTIKISKAS